MTGEITATNLIPAYLASKVKGITIQQESVVDDSKETDQSPLEIFDLQVFRPGMTMMRKLPKLCYLNTQVFFQKLKWIFVKHQW